MNNHIIEIYTDGSCNPQHKIGGWAALIFNKDEKVVLQGIAIETTHNRMELIAVIESIDYVLKEIQQFKLIKIYTDSQYVERIPLRTRNLISNDFKTKSGKEIQNADLVQKLINLINSTEIEFIKVKAHQKASDMPNHNREADKLSRKLVRRQICKK
ncbi:MAG: ribonuclease HI [Bacteroidales bacterium]|nr:ribonuclease HI [Bacteroidales bacterium]